MKQYCKYCTNTVLVGDDYCLCTKKHKMISEASANKANNCRDFELCEISVFNHSQIYKPREEKEENKVIAGQMELQF